MALPVTGEGAPPPDAPSTPFADEPPDTRNPEDYVLYADAGSDADVDAGSMGDPDPDPDPDAGPEADPDPDAGPTPDPDAGPVDAGEGDTDAGPAPDTECVAFATSVGADATCAACLCAAGHCRDEALAVRGDDLSEGVLSCALANACVGDCCVCDSPCSALGLDYGDGPCLTEVELAVGARPGAGALTNGGTVDTECNSSPGSPCFKAQDVGNCQVRHCELECGASACR